MDDTSWPAACSVFVLAGVIGQGISGLLSRAALKVVEKEMSAKMLGRKLKALRTQRELNQVTLAKRARVTQPYISRWKMAARTRRWTCWNDWRGR